MIIASLIVAGIFVAVEVLHVQSRITVGNLDFFTMIDRAKLLPGTLHAWVSGFYPVGIPLILRLGLELGVDVVRTGQAASILGGLLCLYGAAALTFHTTHNRLLALAVMVGLLSTSTILFYSGFEGTDMLAAGFQVMALGILLRDLDNPRGVALAGLVQGLGYLVRYTALVSASIVLAYLILRAFWTRERTNLRLVGFYGGAFLAGASPQLVTSLWVQGTPLYMTQVYHIWLKLYAGSDFIGVLGDATTPQEIGMLELFLLNPARFVTNWWEEFTYFWIDRGVPLIDYPLLQLSRAGFLFMVLDRRLSPDRRALLACYTLGISAALSTFTMDTRFLIFLAPIFILGALYFVWRLVPSRVDLGPLRLPLNLLAVLVLLGFTLPAPWTFARTEEGGPHALVIEVSNRLRAAGAQSAAEVLSTNPYHQDVSSPTRDHYQSLHALERQGSLEELRAMAQRSGYRFIVYDELGLQYEGQYADLLHPTEVVTGFTPIWLPESGEFAAYRIEPARARPEHPREVYLEDGVLFAGYDLTVSEGIPSQEEDGAGLYLYWQATQPLTRSLKVFVHLLDPQGRLVAQDDSVPSLWLQDTRSWQPRTTVIDFHHLALPKEVEAGEYVLAVGLYDEVTGQRQAILDGGAPAVADSITLTRVTLPLDIFSTIEDNGK
jgi:hypothetical protein